jgi:multiple sugar transport system permease protein
MISPSIFFATIMTMITSLQVFAQPQLLTGGGPGNATSPWCSSSTTRASSSRTSASPPPARILFALIIIITALQFGAQKKWVHYEH